MFNKSIALFISLSMLVLISTGCSTTASNAPSEPQANGKVKIITTLFPQYDFVRQIAGDKADVTMLLPPGVESHSYEPTPGDIIEINGSNLFIYTGEYMEAWAQRIIDGLENKSLVVLDVSKNITLSKPEDHDHEEHEGEEEHEDEEEHEEEHNHTFDPHIWTDPNNAMSMVDNIVTALCEVDKINAYFYKTNAEKYKAELTTLDQGFRDAVANGARKEIIFGGRNAMHYFLKQYGLAYESAYDSCSTETEPSVKVVAELIDEIKENKISVIYYEELTTPKVAQSISDETGAKMLLFHSCHNVSKEDFQNGVTYLSLMKQNLANLKEGLK